MRKYPKLRYTNDMKRFIATLISILLISFAALYFISLPHEWEPHAFRLSILAAYLGFSFSMVIYHLFLYFFTSRERVYLLFTITSIFMIIRLATIQGSIAELVIPSRALPLLSYISEVSVPALYIFGHWFSHEMLQIKWGGTFTRIIYIIAIGLPFILTVATGQIVGMWWLFPLGVPHAFIAAKGFSSAFCRANLYMVMYLSVLILFFLSPALIIIPFMRDLFAPAAPFWLMWTLIQTVLLSNNYGEVKHREHELSQEKSLLESLNRTKSEFFGNISHEMKTPLTIIATDIQLAEQFIDGGNLDNAKELLREAWQETMQTSNLVTDALTFAHGQEISRPMEAFSFDVVIDATLAVFEPFIKRQGNVLIRDIAKLPPIKGNADMIASMLVNLLSNANRHTKDGVIKVQWRITDGKYCLTVRDSGSGIPSEILPHVFERGVTGGNGSGFGLAIVKSIAELHNGEVSLESGEGIGTLVTLIFPAALEEQV